jgi:DNA-binding SARP family transcriptional activator
VTLHISLCGEISITTAAGTIGAELRGAQGRITFAHLLLERARPIPRDRLVDVVWNGEPPGSWETAIDALASRTRKALSMAGVDGRSAIRLKDGSYHVDLGPEAEIDVERAAMLVGRAEVADATGDAVAAAEAASQAASLLANDLLAGDANRWVEDRRDDLRSLRKRALLLVGADAADPDAAVGALRRAVDADPFDEAPRALLAERLALAGRAVDALAVLDDAERVWLDELGVPGSATMSRLREQAIDMLGGTPAEPGIVAVGLAVYRGSAETAITRPSSKILRDRPGVLAVRALDEGIAFLAHTAADGVAAAHVLVGDGATGVAIHLGESVADESAWSGPALAVLRTMAGSQAPGVVVTDPLRALLPPDTGEWERVGDVQLRVSGHRVATWRSLGPSPLPLTDLPASCRQPASPIVGRRDELSRLDIVVQRAVRGLPALAVVVGDAGMGKTRLLAAALGRAHDHGVNVMVGRCPASGGAPYQPVAEAINDAVQAWADHDLRRIVGTNAGALARLVPNTRGRLPGTLPMLGTEPDARRFETFEGIRRYLVTAAQERPLILALDDLHWADAGTLDLIEHIIERGSPHLAVIVTTRDGARGQTWQDGTNTDVIRVGELGQDDIVAMIEREVPWPLARTHRLARRISEITAGHPYFVHEILTTLHDLDMDEGEVGDALDIELPRSLRELLTARLERLDPRLRDTMAIAAIAGREIELETLAHTAGLTPAVVLDEVDQAIAAGLMQASATRPDVYGFTHPLLVEALVADLSPARRARLHERIANTLLASHHDATEDPGWLTDVAHHLLDSGNRVGPDRVEKWTRRAALAAEDAGAYASSADLYRKLLRQRGAFEIDDTRTEAALLLALGRAENRAGNVQGALEALVAAVEHGRSSADVNLLAAAAIELGWEWSLQFGAWVDPDVEEVVVDALAALSNTESPEWARVACVRFEHLYYADPTAATDLADRAHQIAIEHGDLATAAQALRHRSHQYAAAPDQTPRIDMLQRSTTLLERAGEPLRAQAERVHEGGARLVAGDVDGFRRIAEQLSQFVERVPTPRLRYFDIEWKAMQAAAEHRDNDAEALIDQAAAIRQRHFPLSLDYPFFQRALLRHAQGRTDEIEPLLALAAEAVPLPAVRASHALALATLDQNDRAREILDTLCHDDLALVPRDFNYLITLGFLADTAHALADKSRAQLLLHHLLPHRDNIAVVGFGTATLGPIAGHIARLATTTGDIATATTMIEHALHLSDRLGDDDATARLRAHRTRLASLSHQA